MTKKIKEIIERLNKEYGLFTEPTLDYETPHELLIATMLSAQCTDERVNMVTKDLFKKYTSVEDFACADLNELEKDIHSVGFYHAKATHIIEACKRLHEVYNDEVPSDIEDLTGLSGVGRKTANVVRTHVFNIPSIVVDTHVKRISNRLGMTKEQDPVKIEFDLMKKLPKEQWSAINLQLITLGRSICTARKPMCGRCFLYDVCPSGKRVKDNAR
ncbi:MAG: endonuclease III [Lachnospiraceae bacterium]|nr:endonuclease III [Lachnospiraceae bacterium]